MYFTPSHMCITCSGRSPSPKSADWHYIVINTLTELSIYSKTSVLNWFLLLTVYDLSFISEVRTTSDLHWYVIKTFNLIWLSSSQTPALPESWSCPRLFILSNTLQEHNFRFSLTISSMIMYSSSSTRVIILYYYNRISSLLFKSEKDTSFSLLDDQTWENDCKHELKKNWRKKLTLKYTMKVDISVRWHTTRYQEVRDRVWSWDKSLRSQDLSQLTLSLDALFEQ